MIYKVIVSERAKEMLGMHIRFLAQKNRAVAVRLKDRLIAEMRSLKEVSHRYPFFNEEYICPNKYHKLYVENWYLILYQIKDDTVYIDWIVDCRQDYQWLLK